jgi:hypothetical protein
MTGIDGLSLQHVPALMGETSKSAETPTANAYEVVIKKGGIFMVLHCFTL